VEKAATAADSKTKRGLGMKTEKKEEQKNG
jgi:hypothetical protein